jgi:hypothetical protein
MNTMKNIAFLAMALAFSGATYAETSLEQSGLLRITDCPANGPLVEDVRITLTAGVVAGFGCSATNVVMAACHTAGRTTSRSALVNLPDGCDPDATEEAEGVTVCTQRNVPQAVTGPAFPFAAAQGGTVSTGYPVASTDGCIAGNAESFAEGKL